MKSLLGSGFVPDSASSHQKAFMDCRGVATVQVAMPDAEPARTSRIAIKVTIKIISLFTGTFTGAFTSKSRERNS